MKELFIILSLIYFIQIVVMTLVALAGHVKGWRIAASMIPLVWVGWFIVILVRNAIDNAFEDRMMAVSRLEYFSRQANSFSVFTLSVSCSVIFNRVDRESTVSCWAIQARDDRISNAVTSDLSIKPKI